MPALLPVILAASHIALVVDAVPKFNVEQTCRRAGEVSASLGYLELPTCLEMAKQAKGAARSVEDGRLRAALAVRISCRAAC
jgi:hypothetical protein